MRKRTSVRQISTTYAVLVDLLYLGLLVGVSVLAAVLAARVGIIASDALRAWLQL